MDLTTKYRFEQPGKEAKDIFQQPASDHVNYLSFTGTFGIHYINCIIAYKVVIYEVLKHIGIKKLYV